MRLIFFCGSLEQGKDGVGDYTIRLASELVKSQHKVAAIALHDSFISSLDITQYECEGISIPVMRSPSIETSRTEKITILSWIETFQPDYISLQFVPFGFQKKGLPVGLGSLLRHLSKGCPLHIMVHELWIGMSKGASIKERVFGLIQKQVLFHLFKTLKPAIVHTQTQLYQIHLDLLGIKSNILPLFSNINRIGGKVNICKENSGVHFVLFGTLHSNAPVEEFVTELVEYFKNKSQTIVFTFIGRNGTQINRWIIALESKKIKTDVLGMQPASKISEVLSIANYGIITTPLFLIEKSGSYAAMLSHNLPIICIANPWVPIGIKNLHTPPEVFEYKPGNLDKLHFVKTNMSAQHTVAEVSKAFLNDLIVK